MEGWGEKGRSRGHGGTRIGDGSGTASRVSRDLQGPEEYDDKKTCVTRETNLLGRDKKTNLRITRKILEKVFNRDDIL